MHKLGSRVNKLVSKTHFFLSGNDIRILNAYNKELLDDANVKPEDFSEEIKRANEIGVDKSIPKSERTERLLKTLGDGLGVIAWR